MERTQYTFLVVFSIDGADAHASHDAVFVWGHDSYSARGTFHRTYMNTDDGDLTFEILSITKCGLPTENDILG